MVRPLSQTGFHRIPHNPRQRVAREGGTKQAGQTLDAFNEQQDSRVLTPRNGWRKLSVKRGRAQALVAHIQNGGSADLRKMRRFLQRGY
jgi:hypothetical protein